MHNPCEFCRIDLLAAPGALFLMACLMALCPMGEATLDSWSRGLGTFSRASVEYRFCGQTQAGFTFGKTMDASETPSPTLGG